MHPLRRLSTLVLLTAAWLLGSSLPVLAGEPPDVVISGLVVLDDEPVALASGSATVQYPGQSVEDVSVVLEAATGEFTITIPAWTDPGAVLLTVELLGEERQADDPDSECQLRIVDEATSSVELATPSATELLVVATPDVVGTICPSTPPDGPGATMPPTDGAIPVEDEVRGGHATLAVLAVLAVTTVTTGVTRRRVSRRGS